ncbi:putative ribonucleotide-diphosphate reductase alpha subunit [Pseudomonas phage 16Q]|nr:putative ribonucleotide-diphosphate reductase alpha subunit [Pseudomonas phage 16Q]
MINYSTLRKQQIEDGVCPPWYTTGGIQLFYDKYSFNNETVKSRFRSVAQAMAKHSPEVYPEWWNTNPYWAGKTWEDAFFQTMWDGFISPSTPLLANGGIRKRGTTVSCAGGNVGNNLFDRYDFLTEAAILTKHSHGTSYCLDDWPAEGDKIRGGRSQGLMPLVRDIINVMEEVAQGSRRGSCAYSLRPQHGDFDKVADYLYERTESNNVGWLIDDEFTDAMNSEDSEALRKFAKMLGIKMPRGKGYFSFIDKMNRKLAKAFKRAGLRARASNLCQETNLPANHEYTFSCVILNYNLELYRSWPEHLVFVGQVMSDCNISEYLECMEEMTEFDKKAMQKIYKFTKEFRALGSGVLGFHTLLQTEMLSVSSMEAMMLNTKVFRAIFKDATLANSWLAITLGEPEGCLGLGQRNATMLMMPPTKSTAELMAGASEGIGLDVAMCFTKQSAGGEFFRINKVLLELIKKKGLDFNECVKDMNKSKGSVQFVDWLTEEEKAVFRTAFEIPMEDHLRLCSQRQQWIDQGQSINLYFTSNDTPEYIGKIHRIAFNDPNILSLYYVYSMRGAGEITRVESCEMCQ